MQHPAVLEGGIRLPHPASWLLPSQPLPQCSRGSSHTDLPSFWASRRKFFTLSNPSHLCFLGLRPQASLLSARLISYLNTGCNANVILTKILSLRTPLKGKIVLLLHHNLCYSLTACATTCNYFAVCLLVFPMNTYFTRGLSWSHLHMSGTQYLLNKKITRVCLPRQDIFSASEWTSLPTFKAFPYYFL